MSSAADSIRFRPLTADDLALLCTWFAEPEVARWWNMPATAEAVRAKYQPRIDGLEPTRMWIAEIDGDAAGLLQSYRHIDYPEHDAAVGIADAIGIDYLLGGTHRARGVGAAVLAAFAERMLDEYPESQKVVATPAQANEVSWRALERAGFVRVGVCRPPDEPPAFSYVLCRAEMTAIATETGR